MLSYTLVICIISMKLFKYVGDIYFFKFSRTTIAQCVFYMTVPSNQNFWDHFTIVFRCFTNEWFDFAKELVCLASAYLAKINKILNQSCNSPAKITWKKIVVRLRQIDVVLVVFYDGLKATKPWPLQRQNW